MNLFSEELIPLLPLHGSLFSRNDARVTQPPPTRTITVELRNLTRYSFPFSPNWSRPHSQSINQSINQPTNQINQINQSINQPTNQMNQSRQSLK